VYPLQLNANPEGWRIFSARKADKAFLAFSKKVYRRDNYACQFCGFQAREYQEIINVDQNYFNNKLSNLATACCFCTQCFFLDAVGVGGYGGGTLIYMPEISQNNLDSFCHVLFCALATKIPRKIFIAVLNYVHKQLKNNLVREQVIREFLVNYSLNPEVKNRNTMIH
jgi:hypothetical protein